MQLYITAGSPYARMARIVVLEKGLEDRVEIVLAQTRRADSPYYAINPSGRVPYLLGDDGVGIEESALICRYLDQIDGHPTLHLATTDGAGWETDRLRALATSLLDGLSVWGREIGRPRGEQSPGVIAHETARAARMVDLWEVEIGHPHMQGPLNIVHITLLCALGLDRRNSDFGWRSGHPKLSAWFDRVATRPSFAATLPPAG